MKKNCKKIFLVILLYIVIAICNGCSSKVSSNKFVKQQNGKFVLEGEEFRFSGTNNYYLNYKDKEMIDDVIENAKKMNLKVIRCWAFLDGFGDSMKNNNSYIAKC